MAVLERHHRFFAKQRIDDFHVGAVAECRQRHVGMAVLLVVQHGMTMEERTAAGVLADQAHVAAGIDQCGVRQVLGETPINSLFAGGHLAAVVVNLRHTRLQRDVGRQGEDLAVEFLQLRYRNRGVGRRRQLATDETGPVDMAVARRRRVELGHRCTRFEALAIGLELLLRVAFGQHAFLDQLLLVQVACGGQLADDLVHHWLRRGRFIGLVVAVAAVADQIDHHVAAELFAEIVGEAGDGNHRFRIITVHMQHRRVDHLGQVGAVHRGTGVLRIGGGEADLVVDHDVQAAADLETAGLRHVEQLHVHALAGQRSVAMDQHGHRLRVRSVATAGLTGMHRASHHRVDDLQVRRVERQRHVHAAIGRLDVGGEAQVVLHVARMGRVVRVLELAFKLIEQSLRRLAQDIDQHVQAATMGHADHQLLDAVVAGRTHDVVDHRDQAVAAFQREALLADILGVQVALQTFGCGQAIQHALLAGLVQGALARSLFQPAVDPVALLMIADVHELGADRAGVGLLQSRQQVAQFQPLAVASVVAGVEFGIQVGIAQAMKGEPEIRRRHLLGQAEWIEIGSKVTARSIGSKQAQYARLLARVLVAHWRGGAAIGIALFLRRFDPRNGRDVGNIPRLATLEGLKVFAPLGGYRRSVGKPGVIKGFNVIGVAASELGGLGKLADQVCTHVTTGREGMLAAIRVSLKSRLSVGIQARPSLQNGCLERIRSIIALPCCDAATRKVFGTGYWRGVWAGDAPLFRHR